jgi:hypothetical protein
MSNVKCQMIRSVVEWCCSSCMVLRWLPQAVLMLSGLTLIELD